MRPKKWNVHTNQNNPGNLNVSCERIGNPARRRHLTCSPANIAGNLLSHLAAAQGVLLTDSVCSVRFRPIVRLSLLRQNPNTGKGASRGLPGLTNSLKARSRGTLFAWSCVGWDRWCRAGRRVRGGFSPAVRPPRHRSPCPWRSDVSCGCPFGQSLPWQARYGIAAPPLEPSVSLLLLLLG